MEEENKKKYIKKFDEWNVKKKILNERVLPDSFFFLEREIWWTSIGVNIGKEIDGKHENFERPVLIFKKLSSDTLWALSISTQDRNGDRFYKIKYKEEVSIIILYQLKFLSINRLLRLIRRIDENEFELIKNKVIDILNKNETSYF